MSNTCEYPRNGVNSWYSSHKTCTRYSDLHEAI